VLNGIGADLKTAKHNDTIDVNTSVADLERRVAAGKDDGTLTAPEADALTKKVADLKAKVSAPTTPAATQALTAEVKALRTEVRQGRRQLNVLKAQIAAAVLAAQQVPALPTAA